MPGIIKSTRIITLSQTADTEPTWTGVGQTALLTGDPSDSHYASLSAAGANNSGSARLAPYDSLKLNGGAVNSAKNDILATGGISGGIALRNKYIAGSGNQWDTRWQAVDQSSSTINKGVVIRYKAKMSGTNTAAVRIKWQHFGVHTGPNQPQYCLADTISGLWDSSFYPARVKSGWCYLAGGDLNLGGYTDDQHAYPQGHCQGLQPRGPYWEDMFNDGLWHRFTHLWRGSSGSGLYNGRAAMWIDGIRIMDTSTAALHEVPSDGLKQFCGEDNLQKTDFTNENVTGASDGSFSGGALSLTLNGTVNIDYNLGDGDIANPDTYAIFQLAT